MFGVVASLVLTYAALLFVSGTLINTGQPICKEVGELIQIATFVEPTISWAETSDLNAIAKSLRLLSGGLPINEVV